MEVYDHLEFIIASRVSDIQWMIAASTYAKTDNKGRKSIDNTLREMAAIQVRPCAGSAGSGSKHAAFDAMTVKQRVLSIGSCLENEGMGFLDRRQHHREWLAEKGISPEDARLRYTEWRAKNDAAREKRRSGDGGDD